MSKGESLTALMYPSLLYASLIRKRYYPKTELWMIAFTQMPRDQCHKTSNNVLEFIQRITVRVRIAAPWNHQHIDCIMMVWLMAMVIAMATSRDLCTFVRPMIKYHKCCVWDYKQRLVVVNQPIEGRSMFGHPLFMINLISYNL